MDFFMILRLSSHERALSLILEIELLCDLFLININKIMFIILVKRIFIKITSFIQGDMHIFDKI